MGRPSSSARRHVDVEDTLVSSVLRVGVCNNIVGDALAMKCQFIDLCYICHISKTTGSILTKFSVYYIIMYEENAMCDKQFP